MYTNENVPNPFQQLYDKISSLERKVDALLNVSSEAKEETAHDEPLTVREAADYLKLSTSTLYGLTSRKEIPFMKRGKRLYFKKEDLREWIEAGSYTPTSEAEKKERVMSHLHPLKRRKWNH
jgi:excisionase family DNA binding protein